MQVVSIITHIESAYAVCNQRLKLEYHEPLSPFAFDFILRRYTEVGTAVFGIARGDCMVRRCTLNT